MIAEIRCIREAIVSNAISPLTGAAAWLPGASNNPDGTQAAVDKATQGRESQEAAIVDAISMNTVPIDIASCGAIIGSVTAAGGAASHGAGGATAVQDVMGMIGRTLSRYREGDPYPGAADGQRR
jgi:hypothetical protein